MPLPSSVIQLKAISSLSHDKRCSCVRVALKISQNRRKLRGREKWSKGACETLPAYELLPQGSLRRSQAWVHALQSCYVSQLLCGDS